MPLTPTELAQRATDLEARLSATQGELQQRLVKVRDELTAIAGDANSAFGAARNDLGALRAEILKLPVTVPPGRKIPGDPGPGKIRWGAAINGNGDPVARHESIAGTPLGVRRTFFDMGKISSLVATAKADLAAGRLPWVSVKTTGGVPGWTNVAGGKDDANIRNLLGQLAALKGPVWLTAWHEPEDNVEKEGGDPAAWRGMQLRYQMLAAEVAPNVQVIPILMSWTWAPGSKRTPANYTTGLTVDLFPFFGIDHYNKVADKTMLTVSGWAELVKDMASRGQRIAIGEWGNTGTDAQTAAEMTEFYNALVGLGCPGAAAFDSNLNSSQGGWELKGEPLTRFRALMKDPRSVRGTATLV